MVRFGLLNFVTFLLSIPILGGGIWLATKAGTNCEKFLQWPLIAIGGFLILLSLAAFLCVSCTATWLLWLYMAAFILLILLLFCFTVFIFVVTSKGAGHAVSGKGYKEYRLGEYSKWLQKRVEKSSHWNKIKSCLQEGKVCKKLAHDSVGQVAEEFYKRNLSPIQSGCCKPPTSCNFVYVNATYWTSTAGNITDMDCARWSNVQNQLCYNCDSCKAGVLAKLKPEWRKIAIINIVVDVLLDVIYTAGCRALRNNRREERNRNGYP